MAGIVLSSMMNLKSNKDADSFGGSVNGDSLNSPGTLKHDGDDDSNINKTEEELEREVKYRKESEAVDKARLMCIMVYLTSALAVSIAVFLVALKNEQATFVSEVS